MFPIVPTASPYFIQRWGSGFAFGWSLISVNRIVFYQAHQFLLFSSFSVNCYKCWLLVSFNRFLLMNFVCFSFKSAANTHFQRNNGRSEARNRAFGPSHQIPRPLSRQISIKYLPKFVTLTSQPFATKLTLSTSRTLLGKIHPRHPQPFQFPQTPRQTSPLPNPRPRRPSHNILRLRRLRNVPRQHQPKLPPINGRLLRL